MPAASRVALVRRFYFATARKPMVTPATATPMIATTITTSISVMPSSGRRLLLLPLLPMGTTARRPLLRLAGFPDLQPAAHVVVVAGLLVAALGPDVAPVAVLLAGAAHLERLAPRIDGLLREELARHQVGDALRVVAVVLHLVRR